MSNNINNTIETQEIHNWPHVPKIQWEQVWWPITNTSITTFLFLILVIFFSVFANRALKEQNSKLKTVLLNILWSIDKYVVDTFHEKAFSRALFPLIVWIFFTILFANLFGLVIDWVWSIVPSILVYIRPINSDLNTTLVLAVVTVVTFLGISMKYNWVLSTWKSYLFNFTWNNFAEKCVNVFVWWLHLIWLPATIASLSLRLFGNIFAWIVLIWVITFLWAMVTENIWILETGRLLSLPFWFFEVFVAFVQAAVFFGLMLAYFSQSKEHH